MIRALWLLALVPLAQPPLSPQSPASPQAPAPSAAQTKAIAAATAVLDRWIVKRYRGVGLLPDTANAAPSLATTRTPPRIESVGEGEQQDSLWAVHFNVDDLTPAFAVNATVRLTGPTGTVTTLAGRVAARRPFRAPRVPGASPEKDSNWREGWAYLVVLPHDASRHVARYRGWLLLTAPRTVRPGSARITSTPRP